jgi:putative phosphoribosyl transferase
MLRTYSGKKDVLVLALPRGGVPVAYEVAVTLNVPLDLFLVRKLGVPGHEELAMGAIATGGIRVLNDAVIRALKISTPVIDAVAGREQHELERREAAYRGGRPAPVLSSKRIILIDDGLATGSTMRAAVAAARAGGPAAIVIAVPVAAPEACEELGTTADAIVCASTPGSFTAVSQWFDEFPQTSDDEVRELYERAARTFEAVGGPAPDQRS